jgi:hypothetical protein
VLLLNECLVLLFISLSNQSGNFWIHPLKYIIVYLLLLDAIVEDLTAVKIQVVVFWVVIAM